MNPTSLAALRASSQKTEDQPEFKIIQTFMEQSSADTEKAVDKVVEITLADVDNEESMHYFYVASSTIEIARRTTPDHHEKLCEFLMELKQRALNHPKTGEPLMINRGAHRVWSDLPCFTWTVNDELQAIGGYDKKTSQKAQRDENLHAFVARLAGYPSDQRVDLSAYSQLNINDAFHLETAKIPPGCAIHTVRLACWWFIFAASTLWGKVQDPKDGDWYPDIWNAYKSGITATQASMRNAETKDLLARAMEEIKKAEERSTT